MLTDKNGNEIVIPGPWANIGCFRRANKVAGYHFFDKNTVLFFSSRIGPKLFAGRFFITSELDYVAGDRRWTIRIANDDGSVSILGEFRQYGTEYAALRNVEAVVSSR